MVNLLPFYTKMICQRDKKRSGNGEINWRVSEIIYWIIFKGYWRSLTGDMEQADQLAFTLVPVFYGLRGGENINPAVLTLKIVRCLRRKSDLAKLPGANYQYFCVVLKNVFRFCERDISVVFCKSG